MDCRLGLYRYPSSSSLKNPPLAPRITPHDVYHDQEPVPDFQLDDIEMTDSGVPSLCSSYSVSPSNSFYAATPPNGAVSKRTSLSSLNFSTSLAQVTTSLASALHLRPPKPPKMVHFSDEVAIIPGGAAVEYYEEEEDYVYAGQETTLESQSAGYEAEVDKYAYRPHNPHLHNHPSHHHLSRAHSNDARLAAAREEQRRKAAAPHSPSSSPSSATSSHRNGIWGQYSWDKWPKSSLSLPLSPAFDFSGLMRSGSRTSTPGPSPQKTRATRPKPTPIQTVPIPTYSRKIPIPTTSTYTPSSYYGTTPPSPSSPPTPRSYGSFSLSRSPSYRDWEHHSTGSMRGVHHHNHPEMLVCSTSPPLPTFEDLNNYSHHNQRNQKLRRQGSTYLPAGGFGGAGVMKTTATASGGGMGGSVGYGQEGMGVFGY